MFVENNLPPSYDFSWTIDIIDAKLTLKAFRQNIAMKTISAVIFSGIFLNNSKMYL